MTQILSSPDFQTQVWKNGGGTTVELFRIPHPQNLEKFVFRLSRAKVEKDGPFSQFDGIDRHLILLDGKGMNLAFLDKRIEINHQFEMLNFRGEDKLDCSLILGPIEDFNVMVDRKWGKAVVKITSQDKGKIHLTPGYHYLVKSNMLIVSPEEDSYPHLEIDDTVISVSID